MKQTSRKSLRLLGSVGEPINPEAWLWYYNVVGERRCPIVDTWWQTETGASLIAPLPGAIATKPGSATLPFFGVEPVIVDEGGRVLEGECEGRLCLRDAGPGMMLTVYGDHGRFVRTYFSAYPGLYFTGDGARRDKDGYYWITGRVDDVINVSGHRLGTAEVESALVAHPKVAEAAVVGYPHELKGQGIYAYVTLKSGAQPSEALQRELGQWVRQGDRPDRDAGSDPVGAGLAQDALGQDHAPHPAQDRRERLRRPRRHLDPRRARRRRRADREPQGDGRRGRVAGRLDETVHEARTHARLAPPGEDQAGLRAAGRGRRRARPGRPAVAPRPRQAPGCGRHLAEGGGAE